MIKIIEDTRQKQDKHNNITRYFEKMKIPVERKKLSVGDYMLSGINNISVDTKSGIDEICMDLGSESSRFRKEMERANELGINLVVLIEDGRFKKISDVQKWKNPNHSKSKLCMNGRELMSRIHKARLSYGVDFVFCKKDETGEKLLKILTCKERS